MIQRLIRPRRRPAFENLEDRRLLAYLEPIGSTTVGLAARDPGGGWATETRQLTGNWSAELDFGESAYLRGPGKVRAAGKYTTHLPEDQYWNSYGWEYQHHWDSGWNNWGEQSFSVGGTGGAAPFGGEVAFRIVPDPARGEQFDDPMVFQAGVNLVAHIRPTTGAGDAQLRLRDGFVEAKLLGHDLLAATRYQLDNLTLSGGLDPRSLNPDGSLSIAMIDEVVIAGGGTLVDRRFGGGVSHPIVIPAPPVLAQTIGSGARLDFDGRFELTLQPTTLWLGLAFRPTVGGGLEYDPAGTALKLTVGAGVSLSAGADLKAEVLGHTVAAADVIGAAHAYMWGRFVVTASGPITSPTIDFDRQRSEAAIVAGFGAQVNLEAFGAGVGFDGAYYPNIQPLFGLMPSDERRVDLQNTVRERVEGLIDTQAKGFTGVLPVKGESMSLLGEIVEKLDDAPPSPQPQMMFAPLTAPAPSVSVLPLDAPLFMGTRGVEFYYNALADRGSLTPGAHGLEVVLFGDDGSEVPLGRFDLADEALAANENPLGFAGGWRRVSLDAPAGALAFGVVYRPEFRLISDGSTGERAAVAIDEVRILPGAPALRVSGDADGVLNMEAEGVLILSNPGAVPLVIDAPTILGGGFELVDPVGSFTILAGGWREVRFRALNPAAAASAVVRIAGNDPARPLVEVALSSPGDGSTPVDPTPTDPKPDPKPEPEPEPGHPVDPSKPDDPDPRPPVAGPTGARVVAIQPVIHRPGVAGFAMVLDRPLPRGLFLGMRPRVVQIVAPGRDQVFGTADDRPIAVTGTRLDASRTRLLVAARAPMTPGANYQIRVLADPRLGNHVDQSAGEFVQVAIPQRPARVAFPPRRPVGRFMGLMRER